MDQVNALERLRNSLDEAPIVWRGDYPYFIHPLTDGVPRLDPDLLDAAVSLIVARADWDGIDAIVVVEAMGLPIGTALATRVGRPLLVVRKRSYALPGEVRIDQTTGYSKGELYLNDIIPGERVLVVDDVVSTGGTLGPVLMAIEAAGAHVADCIVVFEKGIGRSRVEAAFGRPIQTLLKVAIVDDAATAAE